MTHAYPSVCSSCGKVTDHGGVWADHACPCKTPGCPYDTIGWEQLLSDFVGTDDGLASFSITFIGDLDSDEDGAFDARFLEFLANVQRTSTGLVTVRTAGRGYQSVAIMPPVHRGH